jgi:hypothetical protein
MTVPLNPVRGGPLETPKLHRELERLSIRPAQSGVLYISIDKIKQVNRNAGLFFFSPGAIRFFSSRCGETTYCGRGGVYFVTSEQCKGEARFGTYTKKRAYTVRKFNPETCDILAEKLSKEEPHE